jgi:hypothetical protein
MTAEFWDAVFLLRVNGEALAQHLRTPNVKVSKIRHALSSRVFAGLFVCTPIHSLTNLFIPSAATHERAG